MRLDSDAQRLKDVVAAGRRVQMYAEGVPVREALQDDLRRSAILYRMVVHGEAAGYVGEATQAALPGVPWKAMKNFRNILVHRYWSVSDEAVRAAVEESMPQVLQTIEEHLLTLDAPADPA